MKHLVGYTKNAIPVYIDLIRSAAAKHVASQPHLINLAAEALSQIAPKKPRVSVECNMGRDIGYDFVVETTDAHNVFYAQLANETIYTRFVKKGEPKATAFLSLVLERASNGTEYNLCGVWIGRQNPPRPKDANETEQSQPYWDTHALVFDNQAIQPRTISKELPL